MDDHDLIPLDEIKINSFLQNLSGWKYDSNKIFKTYSFNSFTDAVMFINGLVNFCNFHDHHPDICINFKNVRFELTRFSVGGKVTERDFIIAHQIEDNYLKYLDAR